MRLKGGEVYRDELVEIFLGGSVYLVICLQVGSAGERHLRYIVASRLPQIVSRMAVEGEDGAGGTELRAHVADRGTACGGEAANPFTEIFKDGVGAAFDSQLAEDLKDHIFRGCPSRELSFQVHTDETRELQFPSLPREYIHSVGTSYTYGDHAQTAGVGRV